MEAYQYLIKRRVSLGVEGNIGLLHPVNQITYYSPLTLGLYYTAKIGYVIKKRTQYCIECIVLVQLYVQLKITQIHV